MASILRAAPPASPENEAGDHDALFVRTAGRAMRVLSAFHHAGGPLSLSEIAASAGIDRSAAQRLVHTLGKLGYLRRGPSGRGYLPGIRILDTTLDLLRLDPMVQNATPVLMELRKNVRERVDLSFFDETRLVYALRMQSKRETFYASLVGHSVPTYCTAGGRAALSVMPDAEARGIVERTPIHAYTSKTLTDVDEIMMQISHAREQGYAVIVEEFVQGEVAIGVPISSGGHPLGAIHVAGSLSEWTPEAFVDRVAPLASEAARAIVGSL
ncbi:IclR family transcriptional regulator [Allosediminivita pacifica]|uniref:IclR family transcriptional regulator n=1 Tax=Allosediminivita pacifica TaxID=1267769 RepID=A0A2T6AJH4_9RHOB|nr:IclR family transcriptional regulator [Allosediminivita pacifica]PTX43965.1 IclR family transcriptional regulator [Allosediminivita pacifica]GGB21287.1 transcriptional regulator [Allosediminivita pacifica]